MCEFELGEETKAGLLRLAQRTQSQGYLWRLVLSGMTDQHVQPLVKMLAKATSTDDSSSELIRTCFRDALRINPRGAMRVIRSAAQGSPDMVGIAVTMLIEYAQNTGENEQAQQESQAALRKMSSDCAELRSRIGHSAINAC